MYRGADLISEFVPDDNSDQSSSIQILNKYIINKNIYLVLDLGCGEGNSYTMFQNILKNVNWKGLDIESSPEVNRRKQDNPELYFFDGVNIPFEDNYFDLIYCHQVLEHVQKPYQLIKDVCRVLKRNGLFIGSTSHLEMFHSNSTFNYTPYGFSLLFRDTNLLLLELKPGVDFITLFISRIMNRFKILSHIFQFLFSHETPINLFLKIVGKTLKKSNKEINLVKLLFCGQFSFCIVKK